MNKKESTENVFGFMLGHGMYTHATGHSPAIKIKITVESEIVTQMSVLCARVVIPMAARGLEQKGLTLPMTLSQEPSLTGTNFLQTGTLEALILLYIDGHMCPFLMHSLPKCYNQRHVNASYN